MLGIVWPIFAMNADDQQAAAISRGRAVRQETADHAVPIARNAPIDVVDDEKVEIVVAVVIEKDRAHAPERADLNPRLGLLSYMIISRFPGCPGS